METFHQVLTQRSKRAAEKYAILLKAPLDVDGYFVAEFWTFYCF